MLRARLSRHANAVPRVSCPSSHARLVSSAFAIRSASSVWGNGQERGLCTPASSVTGLLPLRTYKLDHLHCTPARHVRCFASKSKRSKKRKNEPEQDRVPAYVETLIHLRDAITDGNVKGMTDAYALLKGSIRLGGEDVGAIAQALHASFRRHRPAPKDKARQAELMTLADLLVMDIRANKLPPNHAAHLHLLAFYKELQQLDKAVDLWDWLVEQDDSYVNPAVYGVAIEVLAVVGRSAEDTENLYVQALKRFPGSFNEYHLSPKAVLPDRSQPFSVAGIPVTLLQGILTARLLRGDSHNAYLALDTGLRLFPAQLPSRFFTLFVEERSVTEAYKVFIMACRSGTAVGPDCLKALLTKLRHVAVADPLANASALRSTLTAAYAFAASGGSLTSNHLTELVITVTSILHHSVVSTLSNDDVGQLAGHVLLLVSRLFGIWAGQDIRPGIAAFNSLITNVAGKGRRKDVIETCLADMQELGLEPTAVTRRSLLTAAGDIGDGDMLQSAWLNLAALRQNAGARLDMGDWQTLAKAARKADEIGFARDQLQAAENEMHPALVARIDGLLQEQTRSVPDVPKDSLEQIRHLIGSLLQDTVYMEEQLESARFRDFNASPIPTSPTFREQTELGSDKQLRVIYDELTADRSFEREENDEPAENGTDKTIETAEATEATEEVLPQGLPADSQPAMSPTGFRYDELRYQNWKTINELLVESEKHDMNYLAAVDAAIQKGTVPPKRSNGWVTSSTLSPSLGLSDLEVFIAKSDESPDPVAYDESLHDKILHLRG